MKKFLFSATIIINLLLSSSVSAHDTPCAHTHGMTMRNLPNTCNAPGAVENCKGGTVCTQLGVGKTRGCSCAKPPPKSAFFSLLLRTTDPLPGLANFRVMEREENIIQAFVKDEVIAEFKSGITGSAQVMVEVLDDRIRLVPNNFSFTTPSETLLQKVTGENHSELVFDRLLGPIDFDLKTGEALNDARVTVQTVNRLFTKENPLISHAVIDGKFDLANGTLVAEGYLEGSIPDRPKSLTATLLPIIVVAVAVTFGFTWLFLRGRRKPRT